MEDWFTAWKIPVGQGGKAFFDFLTTWLDWFFDGLSTGISVALEAMIAALLWPPPLVIVAIFTAIAWILHRSIAITVGVAIGFVYILNQGLWQETVETLALVIGSAAVAMGIGVPVGIAAAHREWLFKLLRPVLDLMQTLPTFVYLIPALVLFGLGLAPGLITTVVFAIPAPIRLTHLGLTTVPKQLIEAGEAFGATKRQLLWKVELPAAWPSIMAGLTQCIMLCLSMVVIAALIGANGLGKPVVRALNTVNIPMGIEAGLAIVVLAIILDRVCRIGEVPGSSSDGK
jgi:glycine betaine/proline transport system permease protein